MAADGYCVRWQWAAPLVSFPPRLISLLCSPTTWGQRSQPCKHSAAPGCSRWLLPLLLLHWRCPWRRPRARQPPPPPHLAPAASTLARPAAPPPRGASARRRRARTATPVGDQRARGVVYGSGSRGGRPTVCVRSCRGRRLRGGGGPGAGAGRAAGREGRRRSDLDRMTCREGVGEGWGGGGGGESTGTGQRDCARRPWRQERGQWAEDDGAVGAWTAGRWWGWIRSAGLEIKKVRDGWRASMRRRGTPSLAVGHPTQHGAHTSATGFNGLLHHWVTGAAGRRGGARWNHRAEAAGPRGKHRNEAAPVLPNRASQTLHTHAEKAATRTTPNRHERTNKEMAQREKRETPAKKKKEKDRRRQVSIR